MTTPAPDSAKTPDAADVLLRVRDLRVAFDTFAGSVHALDGVELEVRRGETLGLVGESGCGKSGTALAVMRLLAAPPARLEGGEVVLAFRVPARPRPGSEAASAARLPDDEPLVDGIARVVRERLDLSGRDPPRRGRPTPPERHRARLVARAALRAIGVPESADSAWRTPGTMSPAERALAERALAWALTPRDSYEVDLLALDEDEMQHVRGNDVAMIFQEPMTSLNPVLRVGEQIAEAVLRHESFAPDGGVLGRVLGRAGLSAPGARERERRAWDAAARMLGTIGFPEPAEALERYPHELSGGMRQRVMIAMALATHPDLLIADEPTTALDVTIQAQIMQLLKELKEASGASLLLITHHLGVVAEMCDRVSVMYAGQVVETAATRDLFQRPAHPYTLALLKSVPDLAADAGDLPVIPGAVPDLLRPPHGCRFHPRCPYAIARCSEERPKAADLGGGHRVACHLWSAPEASLPPEIAAAAAATEAPAAKGAPAPDPAAGAGRATGVA